MNVSKNNFTTELLNKPENPFQTMTSQNTRLVPCLKNMPVPVLVTLKIRYTNRKAPAQRPFLLAGELASPAGRVLVVLG